ncbi:Son of sevenless homolog 2 [Geodia barretti]|uniref:Son of sevenless homolog 2 n=1 Tax=Geodia barretti TaxID=519541 RepID=A0AA35TY32_GEOBA|nr:Son of sevenless homolog 2 [Geodia barretti]
MTYRSFCSPTKLLDLLIERFEIPLPEEATDLDTKKDPLMMKAVKVFKSYYLSPIQLRVVNVLRHWVDFHYYDFQRDQELLTRLHTFITSVKGKKMQKWVAALNRALDKKRDEIPSATKPVFTKKPLPVEWWLTQKPEEFNLLSLHPKDIARQLTLIMAENFHAIHPSELVDASWMKEKKKEMASPNLLKHTRFETMVFYVF